MDYRLLLALFGILFSFLFSASETALTSLGRLETQKINAKGGAAAKLIRIWTLRPNHVLISILIGNNIAGILCSSMIAIYANQEYPLYVSIVIGAFTFFFILTAEIMPKIIARQKALLLAPWAMRFLRFTSFFLFPFIWTIEKLTEVMVRILGLPQVPFHRPMNEEELEHTIEMATKDGGLDRETGEVLSNLIDFPDRIARDIMVSRSKIHAISIETTQQELFQDILSEGYSRMPVYRKNLDQVVGILHVKDLIGNMHFAPVRRSHWTRMVRRPYFVSEMAHLGDILKDMKRWGTHMAIVRNESGVITGLLTLEDLIEEIVGEIRDEHDGPEEAGFEDAMGAPKIVEGDLSLVDFNELYNCKIPMDVSYSTLNGYILSKCGGKLPAVGSLIIDDDFTFRVHSINEQGVARLELIESD